MPTSLEKLKESVVSLKKELFNKDVLIENLSSKYKDNLDDLTNKIEYLTDTNNNLSDQLDRLANCSKIQYHHKFRQLIEYYRFLLHHVVVDTNNFRIFFNNGELKKNHINLFVHYCSLNLNEYYLSWLVHFDIISFLKIGNTNRSRQVLEEFGKIIEFVLISNELYKDLSSKIHLDRDDELSSLFEYFNAADNKTQSTKLEAKFLNYFFDQNFGQHKYKNKMFCN